MESFMTILTWDTHAITPQTDLFFFFLFFLMMTL